jgi:hypothetical protein
MNTTTVRAACPHDCPDTCAIRVTVQDGRAIKVQGDPDHPPTHGCIGVPEAFAAKLFAAASLGDEVSISRGKSREAADAA